MSAIESLRENRSHAVCKSRKLFDMERFHDSLVGFWSFTARENIVNYGANTLIIKSLKQIYKTFQQHANFKLHNLKKHLKHTDER